MDTSLRFKIGLSLLTGLSPDKQRLLLEHFESAEAIFCEKNPEILYGLSPKILEEISNGAALKRADKEIEFIEKNHLQVRFIEDTEYPARLRTCNDAPLILYSKGCSDLNAVKVIAVVGTRRATSYGRDLTESLVRDFAQAFPDIIIVSGLAYGIDICAHKAALANGLNTAAVLAHGLHEIYPAPHRKIAIEMLRNGSLITELPSGTPSEAWRFIQRNRIVAGLCDACVVVESAAKGGSLITARMAADYGREVYAFPGRPVDERSKGCNMLIKKQVAALVESAEDIMREMNWETPTKVKNQQTRLFPELTPELEMLYDFMNCDEKKSSEQIASQTQKSIGETLSTLMQLEMEGLIEALPGGFYLKKYCADKK
jgi:DNA processing protein